MAQATVYQKHMAMRSRGDEEYGLTPARCRKVKGGAERGGDEARGPEPKPR